MPYVSYIDSRGRRWYLHKQISVKPYCPEGVSYWFQRRLDVKYAVTRIPHHRRIVESCAGTPVLVIKAK